MIRLPFFPYFSRMARLFRKEKIFTVIHIAGLAVGLACTLLIVLWVRYERSFDGFHTKKDDLYRVINQHQRNGVERNMDGTPGLLGPALKENFPEIRDFTRLASYSPVCRGEDAEGPEFRTRLIEADPQFFRLFDFPFIQGQSQTALSDPYSIVISEKTARALFGTTDPMGKTVIVATDDHVPFKVAGVVKDVPEISHIQFDVAIPLGIYRSPQPDRFFNNWKFYATSTYVLLEKNVPISEFENKLTAFVQERDGTNKRYRLWLQSLGKIHLDSRIFSDETHAAGVDSRALFLFSLIAFVVLAIACINFMNLTTARAFARAKEVGVRKVNGASKRDLVKLFLFETLGLFGLAMMLGLLLLQGLLPLLRSLTGRLLDLRALGQAQIGGIVVGVTLISALAAGILPALVMASFRPADTLKNRVSSGRWTLLGLRRVLLSVQFISAAVLIGITVIVFYQLHFLKTKNLGFDQANMIEIDYAPELEGRSEAWKNDLLASPGVLGATTSRSPYISGAAYKKFAGTWEGKTDVDDVFFYIYDVDFDFLKSYGVPLQSGRFFAPDSPEDPSNILVNETAARIMGLADPVGKRMNILQRTGTIIGVVGDFNATSLRSSLDPTVFILANRKQAPPALTVRIHPQDVPKTLQYIESIWRKYCPGKPFQYHFMDDILRAEFYAHDDIFGRMMAGFAVLALLVAGLGLFGLVAFGAERKTREIGIRKILGATRAQILALMSKDVVPVIVVSNIVAWPLIVVFAGGWLRGFAYRVGFSWWLVALTVSFTGAVAIVTIGYHVLKVSQKKPSIYLRYE